jgi:hypothetical protein
MHRPHITHRARRTIVLLGLMGCDSASEPDASPAEMDAGMAQDAGRFDFPDITFDEADAAVCDLAECGLRGHPDCDGAVALTPSAATHCQVTAGTLECTWPAPDRRDCAAQGRLCRGGECVLPGAPDPTTLGAETYAVADLTIDTSVAARDLDGDAAPDNRAAEVLARFSADLREDIVATYLSGPLTRGAVRLLVARLPDARWAFLSAGIEPETGRLQIHPDAFHAGTAEPVSVLDAAGDSSWLALRLAVGDAALTLHFTDAHLEFDPGAGVATLSGRVRVTDFVNDLNALAATLCGCLGLGDRPLISARPDGTADACLPTRETESCNGDDFGGRPDEYVCQRFGDDCNIIIRRVTADLSEPAGPAISAALGFRLVALSRESLVLAP